MADHTVTVSANLGCSTNKNAGKGWYRSVSSNLGLDDSLLPYTMIFKRLCSANLGLKSFLRSGSYQLGRTSIVQYRQPMIPAELCSGQTRGYTLTATVLRVFPVIDRTTGALSGTNSMGWLYPELEPMQAAIISIDWLDTAYSTAEVLVRHDGYDSRYKSQVADEYYSWPDEAMVQDVVRPGWKVVNALNPLLVRLKDLPRLRAMAPSGSVKINVETLEFGGKF